MQLLLCEILTRNVSYKHQQFLVLQTASVMCIKGLRLRYAEFIIPLSILKGTIDIS